MATFYITKYALSGGIVAIESEASVERWHSDGEYSVRDTRKGYFNTFNHREAFADESAAIDDAERRRLVKIQSLRKQIAKLEKLEFKPGASQ